MREGRLPARSGVVLDPTVLPVARFARAERKTVRVGCVVAVYCHTAYEAKERRSECSDASTHCTLGTLAPTLPPAPRAVRLPGRISDGATTRIARGRRCYTRRGPDAHSQHGLAASTRPTPGPRGRRHCNPPCDPLPRAHDATRARPEQPLPQHLPASPTRAALGVVDLKATLRNQQDALGLQWIREWDPTAAAKGTSRPPECTTRPTDQARLHADSDPQ